MPMKICSLLPGATEVVAALGLADHLVGISHECDYPPAIKTTPVMIRAVIDQEQMTSPDIDQAVTRAASEHRSLYMLDDAMFRQAEPDLVITQDLCHVCAVTPSQLHRAIDSLPCRPHVLTLNAASLEDMFIDIERIGEATNAMAAARTFTSSLRTRLQDLRTRVSAEEALPTVVCVEWLDPLYAAGHWVPEMVSWAGAQHLVGRAGGQSERITWEQLAAAAPDVLIVMPCGFSIERTVREMNRLTSHPEWSRLPAVQHGRVFAVDSGAFFSRPGPRLVDGTEILAALCHPSLFGQTTPAGARQIATSMPASPHTDVER